MIPSLQDYIEIPAMLTGLANIYLAARANIWNWLFGLITVTLYAMVFYQSKLYADMCLQFVYLALQIYGWYQWRYNNPNASLQIVRMNKQDYYLSIPIMLGLFAVISYVLSHYTDSTTVYLDASTTTLSLIAQWMMCRKLLENWWLWMILDIISIDMYWIKHLYLTSGLYGVFFILCCMGYRNWKAQMNNYTSTVQP
jgi:nicotinamide mononucleotide transporter